MGGHEENNTEALRSLRSVRTRVKGWESSAEHKDGAADLRPIWKHITNLKETQI